MLLLNAFARFGLESLIGICCGNAGCGGVLFLSCCGINSSSIGFGLNVPTLMFGVVIPLPVDWIELFMLLLFVLVLLLLIGAIAVTELFIEAGGKIPDDVVVKPDIKPKVFNDQFNVLAKSKLIKGKMCSTSLIRLCWYRIR